ncbi:MAG: hypothetical protein QT08_C0019G0001 [archaeon GW2011_AR17]|nr:MAG: hypothetical protein QT08_C0019G0001 [archaeon GW2011_AR17]MBS3154704.1 hypothetical protein [Candidatus Woesearchaeota archaeon]HIH15735.1 hypothetical protein [Nanoarchaeota archaeon]HIH58453.1 hypothetical protein [Nanoarchaeota archaeon]HII13697.1 hypothetical protein [Nanoarchaeota archaeon]
MNAINQTFQYEASTKRGWPRDISLQDFARASKDILRIISQSYESLETIQEVIHLEESENTLENIIQDQSTGSIFNFQNAEVPFQTHKAHGNIRIKGAEPQNTEKHAQYIAAGVLACFIPPILVLAEQAEPYFLCTSLLPALAIVAPNIYALEREEEKRRIKIIELEFHTLERKGNENGRIKDLFKKLGEYRIK